MANEQPSTYGAYINSSEGKKDGDKSPQDTSNSSSGSSVSSKEQHTLDRLYEIAQKNQEALGQKFRNASDMYDVADSQIRALAENQRKEAMANSDDEWFDQQKDFQTAVNNLKNTAGESLSGSNVYNLMNLIENYDDKIDRNTASTLRKNLNEINKDEFDSLAANVNARNELAADTEYALRQLANDYLAQRVNVNPENALGQAWDDWSNVGQDWYKNSKTGPATYTNQGLITDSNAKYNANQLTNSAQANESAANKNYFADLLNSRNRRY